LKKKQEKAGVLMEALGQNDTAACEGMPQPGDIIGDSEVERVLGRGSFAVVYLTYNKKADIRRAVKMLLPNAHDNNMHRFIDEARIYAKFDHPHIVRFNTIGTWKNKLPYIEMEHVDGPSLEFIIKKFAPLPRAVVLSVAIQICTALDYALNTPFTIDGVEKMGVIHRDIKPGNILFNSKGEVKVVDFGFARIGHVSSYTNKLQVPGTVLYMSPEQQSCDLDKIDHRSDIFAVGIILYEMLAGRLPFPDNSLEEMLFTKKREKYDRLKDLDPDSFGSVDGVVDKMLRADPKKRWNLYETLVMALESSLKEITGRSPDSILFDYIQYPEKFNLIEAPQSKKFRLFRLLFPALGGIALLALVFLMYKFITSQSPPSDDPPITYSIPGQIATAQQTAQRLQNDTNHPPEPPELREPVAIQPPKEQQSEPARAAEKPAKKNGEMHTTEQRSPEVPLTIAIQARNHGNWDTVIQTLAPLPKAQYRKASRDSITLLLLEAYCKKGDYANASTILGGQSELFDAHYYLYAANVYAKVSEYEKARDAFDKAVRLPTILDPSIRHAAWEHRARFLESSLDSSIPEQKTKVAEAWSDYYVNVCLKGNGSASDCKHAKTVLGIQ